MSMKKLLAYCLLAVLPSMEALAYDFESDGVYYTITGSNTVSVVSGDYAYDGDITIPQAVGLSGKTYLVTAIGDNAFQSNTALESVTLPEGLTMIGNQAFRSSSVKTVSLPSTLSSMGTSAFRECMNLTGIVLPDALKNVNEYAFSGCLNLKTLSLGNQTINIEQYAFNNTGIENLSIPNSVKIISNHAFDGCTSLKTLSIDNAKVSIKGRAFGNCENLVDVNLGNAVVELGTIEEWSSYTQYFRGAFWNCTNITSIKIPSSITSIGDGSFDGCSRLREVELPATITSIGNYAFSDCLIDNIILPSSLTNIGDYAFYNCPIREIELQNGLLSIGRGSFADCLLTEITVPVSVNFINGGAFANCRYLKTVRIDNAPVTIEGAFMGCTALENIDLGTAVVALNQCYQSGKGFSSGGCFENCISLKSIVLPNTIHELTYNLFYNCTGLSEVKLPNELNSIGQSSFMGCTSLRNIVLPNTVQFVGSGAFMNCSNLKSVVLSTSLKTIESSAFYNCSSLQEIVIPEAVTEIGSGAFRSCIALKSVQIDNAICEIGAYAFRDCKNLTEVDMGKTTTIGYGSFMDCISLAEVFIPNSVTEIVGDNWKDGAFQNCTSLRKVTLGLGLNKIINHTFQDCIKLSEIVFTGNNIVTIKENAFQNCRSLKNLELPASLTSIEGACFTGCTSLANIYSLATTPPVIQGNTFPDYETPTLHVPASAKTAYSKADYWKQFEKVIAIGSEPKATVEEIAALETLLGEAQTLYNNAVEGTEPGNYRPGAKAALKAVINEVSARISEDMLTEDVEDCTELLNTAIRSFKNKQVKNDYQTDNTLAFASSLKASRGVEFRLPIEMNNVNEISGVQFDLYLSEGLMLSKDENEDYEIELSERASNQHAVSARIMDDGALRVLVTSSQNATFTGNSGTLLTLKLFPQSTMEAGDYDVELKNIVLTDPQATRYAAEDIKSVISVSAYTLGDVNNDTHIDVADLTGVVLFILENADASLVFNAADMDGNGVVEVNDYAALVNVILAQDESQNSRLYGMNDAIEYPNVIGLNDLTLNERGEGELLVTLRQKDYAYSGMQFDLYLPEGIILNEEESVASGSRHGLWMQKHADGNYRIICSSMMNAELNAGVVIRLQVKSTDNMQGNYQVMIDNVVLSDVNAKRHEVANANAQLTVGGETTGIITIGISTQKNVFDMQGRRVDAVKKGVYVVNGKKVVVQ